MWQLMSGRVHQVITAISLVNVTSPEETLEAYSTSEVEFDAISTDEMEYYWQSGEPRDKAGAYAIQGYAACWVKHLSGSYSGVMGLPLCETRMLLKRAMVWHR